jgi:hypothetical protein
LVDDERLIEMPLQQRYLSGRVIAHAEIADFAAALEFGEGFGDFFRFH